MRYLMIAVAGIALLGGAAFSAAQDEAGFIPQDLLDLTYQQCYRPCREGFTHQVCDTLCTCSVDSFRRELSFERYVTLLEAMSKDAVSTADRNFLDRIAKQCADTLDAAGIAVEPLQPDVDGLPAPPKPDPEDPPR